MKFLLRKLRSAAVFFIVILIVFFTIKVWTIKRENPSLYKKIISGAATIKNKEYPLRYFISNKAIQNIKFLDGGQLKDNTKIVIIVLGDRPLDRTTPTVDMIYRVLKGVELSKKYPKAILIMSGGPTAGDISEAEMMGLIAWSRGVNPSRIILEDKSRNTEQNAEFTAKILKSKDVGQKFIVTNQSRLEQATRIFQNYFIEFKDVQGVDCNVPIKSMAEQMEQYLKNNDNRVVRKRLERLNNTIKGVDYNVIDKISTYGKIISNAGSIRSAEFPLRNPISNKEIEKAKFLNPQQLKGDVKTAIFVLPNRPLDEVTPSVDSVYRALKAVELCKKIPDAVLIMIGPKSVGDVPESQMMALVAWSRGVDASRIIVEDTVRGKEDKAEFIARMIRSKNITRAFIVSKKEHLKQLVPFFQSRYKEVSKNTEGVDCGITKDIIIGQMTQYLKTNDDKVVRRRIDNVKKGRIGID